MRWKLGKMLAKVTALGSEVNLRKVLRHLFAQAIAATGITRLAFAGLRKLDAPDRLIILVYHRVLSDSTASDNGAVSCTCFDNQMRLLKRWFRVVCADEALAILKSEPTGRIQKGWRYPLLITFDDGYMNNMKYAIPILRRHEIQALFFVTTGVMGTATFLWPDEVTELIITCPQDSLQISINGTLETWPLGGKQARLAAASELKQQLKSLPHTEFVQHLQAVRNAAAGSGCLCHHDGTLMLDWDGVRLLREWEMAIGSHTSHHWILSQLSPSHLKQELEKSQQEMETHLGVPAKLLAYPNGRPQDHGAQVAQEARRAGFSHAFTMEPRMATGADDSMAIPRIPPQDESGASLALSLLKLVANQLFRAKPVQPAEQPQRISSQDRTIEIDRPLAPLGEAEEIPPVTDTPASPSLMDDPSDDETEFGGDPSMDGLVAAEIEMDEASPVDGAFMDTESEPQETP